MTSASSVTDMTSSEPDIILCHVMPNDRFYLPTSLLPLSSYPVLKDIEGSIYDFGLGMCHFPNKSHSEVVAALSALVPPMRVGGLPSYQFPSAVSRIQTAAPSPQVMIHVPSPTDTVNNRGLITPAIESASNATSLPFSPVVMGSNVSTESVRNVEPINSTLGLAYPSQGSDFNEFRHLANSDPLLPIVQLDCHASSPTHFFLDLDLIPERGVRCLEAINDRTEGVLDYRANLWHFRNAAHEMLMSELYFLEPPIILSELPVYQEHLCLSSGSLSIESLRPVPKLNPSSAQCYVFDQNRYFLYLSDLPVKAKHRLQTRPDYHTTVLREDLFHFDRSEYAEIMSLTSPPNCVRQNNGSRSIAAHTATAPSFQDLHVGAHSSLSQHQTAPTATPQSSSNAAVVQNTASAIRENQSQGQLSPSKPTSVVMPSRLSLQISALSALCTNSSASESQGSDSQNGPSASIDARETSASAIAKKQVSICSAPEQSSMLATTICDECVPILTMVNQRQSPLRSSTIVQEHMPASGTSVDEQGSIRAAIIESHTPITPLILPHGISVEELSAAPSVQEERLPLVPPVNSLVPSSLLATVVQEAVPGKSDSFLEFHPLSTRTPTTSPQAQAKAAPTPTDQHTRPSLGTLLGGPEEAGISSPSKPEVKSVGVEQIGVSRQIIPLILPPAILTTTTISEQPQPGPVAWIPAVGGILETELVMPELGHFKATLINVSHNIVKGIFFPEAPVQMVGRINPETVWDYIDKLKKNNELMVFRLSPATAEDQKPYTAFYAYLSQRNRFGVLGGITPPLKDVYLIPQDKNEPIHKTLLPFRGPGLSTPREHSLLVIVTRHTGQFKSKRPSTDGGVKERRPSTPTAVTPRVAEDEPHEPSDKQEDMMNVAGERRNSDLGLLLEVLEEQIQKERQQIQTILVHVSQPPANEQEAILAGSNEKSTVVVPIGISLEESSVSATIIQGPVHVSESFSEEQESAFTRCSEGQSSLLAMNSQEQSLTSNPADQEDGPIDIVHGVRVHPVVPPPAPLAAPPVAPPTALNPPRRNFHRAGNGKFTTLGQQKRRALSLAFAIRNQKISLGESSVSATIVQEPVHVSEACAEEQESASTRCCEGQSPLLTMNSQEQSQEDEPISVTGAEITEEQESMPPTGIEHLRSPELGQPPRPTTRSQTRNRVPFITAEHQASFIAELAETLIMKVIQGRIQRMPTSPPVLTVCQDQTSSSLTNSREAPTTVVVPSTESDASVTAQDQLSESHSRTCNTETPGILLGSISVSPTVDQNQNYTSTPVASAGEPLASSSTTVDQIHPYSLSTVQIPTSCASTQDHENTHIPDYQTIQVLVPLVSVPCCTSFVKIIKFGFASLNDPTLKVMFRLRVSSWPELPKRLFTKLKIWVNGRPIGQRLNFISEFTADITNNLTDNGQNSIRVSSKINSFEMRSEVSYFVTTVTKTSVATKMLDELMKKECIPAQMTILMVKSHLKRCADVEDGIVVDDSKLPISLLCPLGRTRIRVPCRGSTCPHHNCFDALNFFKLYENSKSSWKCPICGSGLELDNLRIDGLFQEILSSIGDPKVNLVTIDSSGTYAPVISPVANRTTLPVPVPVVEIDDAEDYEVVNISSESGDSSDEEWNISFSSRRKPKRKTRSTSPQAGPSKLLKTEEVEVGPKCNCTTRCNTQKCPCIRRSKKCNSRCHTSNAECYNY